VLVEDAEARGPGVDGGRGRRGDGTIVLLRSFDGIQRGLELDEETYHAGGAKMFGAGEF